MVDELDDVILHALESPDRNAELHPGLRVDDRFVVDRLASADDVRAQER
jgi:hypothetical protein